MIVVTLHNWNFRQMNQSFKIQIVTIQVDT